MANNNNNGSWGATPTHTESDGTGLQSRPMGLKIHYTFDRDSKQNCLARWPHILHIQTIPIDDQNSIGVVDLTTCLQSIAQCSPELAGDSERDYTVYAYDYSEPDTPLVGQGMFNWALNQNGNGPPQLVTGRVTKNMLAIFGQGIQETLEVKLKLTAIPKIVRVAPTVHAPTPVSVHAGSPSPFPPTLQQTSSMMSETNEWHAFVQANPNLGPTHSVSIQSPVAVPMQPFNPTYETQGQVVNSNFQTMPSNAGSRPGSQAGSRPGSRPGSSMGPATQFQNAPTPQASSLSQVFTQSPQQQQPVVQPVNTSASAQPRPSSRPSSRASTTARPRGRPRKNPLPVEGSTSGYEDGTDGDEPQRTKKRAKTTKVERSNTAKFGSAPESLRVAASTSGSLRNFRPIGLAGEGAPANHLQEMPRAPTPVPAQRPLPGPVQQHPPPPSQLRRQSTSNLSEQNGTYTNAFLDVRSMSFGPDARSPTDSLAPSPSQYSEGPSPADIGSSPPVPRSVMFPSARSSPAPSSPILPPMRAQQIDSGFMSGGIEGSRLDDEDLSKTQSLPPVPAAEKPKPKAKPRKSRAKKQQPVKNDQNEQPSQAGTLIIQTETPGPPELLPTTSIYNPPNHQSHYHKQVEEQGTTPKDTPLRVENVPRAPHNVYHVATPEIVVPREPSVATEVENTQSQDDLEDLERVLMGDLEQRNAQYFQGLATSDHPFGQNHIQMQPDQMKPTTECVGLDRAVDPPSVARSGDGAAEEPQLPPMVPASDPRGTQSYDLGSEPAHPQTDGAYNKNAVKKQTIKQRLEEALAAGQMPPFCNNCGAIETPTWRKIYKQLQTGAPTFHVYSDKPGRVTAINIVKQDGHGNITSYEMVKKCLGPDEDKSAWRELLLCNPCGLWFSKWKQPRPADKWEKDQQRLGQTRKRKDPSEKGVRAPRPRKPRTKSGSQTNPASDMGLMTDPLMIDSSFSPKEDFVHPFGSTQLAGNEPMENSEERQAPGSSHSRGSTHSRGSGKSPASPIAVDDEFGTTRRLLFPSPRKDGEHKILGEVAVNLVQTPHEFRGSKTEEGVEGKENLAPRESDDTVGLFGTPARPSTPPPKSVPSGTFKTPNRPTPSHRPVTRSVSKSIRSVRSVRSPAQGLTVQRTPSRTPRSGATVRRSPRVAGLPSQLMDDGRPLDSPFTKSINKLLSEASDFMGPDLGGTDLTFGNLPHDPNAPQPPLDAPWDFGHLLPGPDEIMPSSPPTLQHGHHAAFLGRMAQNDDIDIWEHFQSLCNTKIDEDGREVPA
ncbi:gata transcription factor [Pestalotiopsis sp. NC0098]|nr:gata transcription factor [Pestalotiopsis sp. NC0098]